MNTAFNERYKQTFFTPSQQHSTSSSRRPAKLSCAKYTMKFFSNKKIFSKIGNFSQQIINPKVMLTTDRIQ